MAGRKQTEIVQVNLRITEGLRKQLMKAADDERRSLNQEMTMRLEQSFRLTDRQKLEIEEAEWTDTGEAVARRLEDVRRQLLRDE